MLRRLAAALVATASLSACAGTRIPSAMSPAATTPPATPSPPASPASPSPTGTAATAEVRYPWQDPVVSADGRTLTVTVPYYGECDTFSRLTLDETLVDGAGNRMVRLETYKRRPERPAADCAGRGDPPTTHSVRLREPLGDREVVQRSRPAPVPPGQEPDPSAETAD